MHILLESWPEIRYLRELPERQIRSYIDRAAPQMIDCLHQIVLNLLYSGAEKNGISLSTAHIKKLKKHKNHMVKLAKTTNKKKQRKLLKKGGMVLELLTVLSSVIATLAATL